MKPAQELTILVTGATDGIGKLTALGLARQQAHVLVHGRDKEKLARVVKEKLPESTSTSAATHPRIARPATPKPGKNYAT